jgi:hypothetical protein
VSPSAPLKTWDLGVISHGESLKVRKREDEKVSAVDEVQIIVTDIADYLHTSEERYLL